MKLDTADLRKLFMTIEVTLLVWSTALFGLYVGTQSILYRIQHGVMFAATGRDNEPPPNVWNGRAQKALRNLIETYGVFVALMAAAAIGDPGDGVVIVGAVLYLVARAVYLPLYVYGVKFARSFVWCVAAGGLIAMFAGLVL